MTDQYSDLYQSFEWLVPANFNIADACCHRWTVTPQEIRQSAIFFEDHVGQLTMYSYRSLSDRVNKLANGLNKIGVQPQDRIIIALQHSAESVVTLLAALTVGAIAIPLTTNLNSEQYARRITDSQAKLAIVDKHTIQPFMSAVDNHSSIRQIIGIDTDDDRIMSMKRLLERQESAFKLVEVTANTPALMFYPENDTADTADFRATVLSHKALIGSLPGFVASQDWFPKQHDIFWSSYDWNSAYGLLNAVLPVLYFGRTIVGCPSGRTISRLFHLFRHYDITNILTSAKELHRIRAYSGSLEGYDLKIRTIACPDTDKSTELMQWVSEFFTSFTSQPIALNGIYAPLGFGYIVGDSNEKWPAVANSMGRVYPGHSYAIINERGEPLNIGEKGFLAIGAVDKNKFVDPAMATQYWQNAQLHTLKPINGWFNTHINAYQDTTGYIWRC